MVNFEMKFYNIYVEKVKIFGIICIFVSDRYYQERSYCSEFLRFVIFIIVFIINFYKDRLGGIFNDNEVALLQVFVDFSRVLRRSVSNSSNSDSGFGFGKDDFGYVYGVEVVVVFFRFLDNLVFNFFQLVWQNQSCFLKEGLV